MKSDMVKEKKPAANKVHNVHAPKCRTSYARDRW